MISSTGRGVVHIPNWKEASPYPQLERGRFIFRTRKRPVHIFNGKGAGLYPQLKRG